MRPYDTNACGLKLLVYAALRYSRLRISAIGCTSVCGLLLLTLGTPLALQPHAALLLALHTRAVAIGRELTPQVLGD